MKKQNISKKLNKIFVFSSSSSPFAPITPYQHQLTFNYSFKATISHWITITPIKIKLEPKSHPPYLLYLCNFSKQKKNEERKVERETERASHAYTDLYTYISMVAGSMHIHI
ncbi:hypothetical protein LguiA_005041 [Lonicera macranthoides]